IRILCHRDPDGDTYGSAMALYDALTGLGKRVYVECRSPFPANLLFLARETPAFAPKFTVAVDVAAPSMIGDPPESRPEVDLCIDHHPTNPLYAKETFLVNYAATGEAIYEILCEMGIEITPYTATALFVAMSSDTGGFRYSNTTPKTLRIAADLMDKGADFNRIRVALFESKSRGQVQVESDALSSVRYYAGGRIAVIVITLAMLEKADADESELEGIASKPLAIDGVDIGITLKEREDGSVRVSMRSTDKANVSQICQQFEGGGHIRAAGCRLWDSLADTEATLVAACEKALLI
ncbi:MAG TPA: bifunctional oligoribonuclease/PAP phosphatase NrnA, partial [Clostridia bacterium]|nr:bifunctional oligoribonuclease/PAP phosphatase NrnA [Clostridia bacterium]